MPVTTTAPEMVARIRGGSGAATATEVAELLGYATAQIERYLGSAYATTPDVVLNEAARRIVGYLFDRPQASRYTTYAGVLRNSGAGESLLAYRIHRAGSTADAIADAQAAVGDVGNPVTDVAYVGDTLTVTFADGDANTYTITSGDAGDGMVGVDQTARDAATAAQGAADTNAATATAHAADPDAHHIPGGSGDVVSANARLPANDVALRLGWAQTQTPVDAIFTRADNHPTDGAAVGTVAGTPVPPFPPALNTDPDLYLFIWIAAGTASIADVSLSGGGGTLIGSGSALAPYTYDGTAGTIWVSNQRLSPGLSAFQISALVVGDLIASQPWVTEQIAAIPAPTPGGNGGFPTTRTEILNVTATGGPTHGSHVLSEALLPNQLYELRIQGRTRHIVLSQPSGTEDWIYDVPDVLADADRKSAYLFASGTIGSTAITTNVQREGPSTNVSFRVNKLT